jgi:hypothetical protein
LEGEERVRSVAVVTATTGRKELEQTIESVAAQTYPCKHYVFFDGVEPRPLPNQVLVTHLPVKTGANGMLNGGINAMSAFIAQEDLICWVDDDNWLEPNHVESLVEALGQNRWAYTLRNLVEQDGSFYDHDDGESLGVWTGFVDANCYMVTRRNLATVIAHNWYTMGNNGINMGDRAMSAALRSLPANCTGEYTVNYRINARQNIKDFFAQENAKMRAKFGDQLPWRKK